MQHQEGEVCWLAERAGLGCGTVCVVWKALSVSRPDTVDGSRGRGAWGVPGPTAGAV